MTATIRAIEIRRVREAVRLFNEAAGLHLDGREHEAAPLYRRAALLGLTFAQSNLGVLLTGLGGAHQAEGVRWLKRAAYGGDPTSAWNLAMEHRLCGRRGAYLRWIRVAVRLGHPEAALVAAEIDRRRAAGEPWHMLKTGRVDALDVLFELDEVRTGEASAADAADWADGAVARRWAAGLDPDDRKRLLPVLWEMSGGDLTPDRAHELMFKLAA